MLRAFGCSPVAAASGEEALRAVRADPRHMEAAVVDIVLPDMSGLELVRILRTAGYVQHVVCTSGFPPGYIPEAYGGSLENCYFLQKPFTPQQLRAILCEAWGTAPDAETI
jgi:CheY-like chemotaxis protein